MKNNCRICKNFNRENNTCSELVYANRSASVRVHAESWVENHDIGLGEHLSSRDIAEVTELLYCELPELRTIQNNKSKIKSAFAEVLEQFIDLTLRPYVVDEVQRNLTDFAETDTTLMSGGIMVDDDFYCNKFW